MSKDLFSGLPDELQEMLDDVEKGSSIIQIKVERRKYGKFWAVVSGFDSSTDLKGLLKIIKNKMACGGTVKDRTLEILYGKRDRSPDLIDILAKEGFNRESIHVTSSK